MNGSVWRSDCFQTYPSLLGECGHARVAALPEAVAEPCECGGAGCRLRRRRSTRESHLIHLRPSLSLSVEVQCSVRRLQLGEVAQGLLGMRIRKPVSRFVQVRLDGCQALLCLPRMRRLGIFRESSSRGSRSRSAEFGTLLWVVFCLRFQ
jgi:hypothetical protein